MIRLTTKAALAKYRVLHIAHSPVTIRTLRRVLEMKERTINESNGVVIINNA
jgi:hypothetical protein